MNKPQITVAHEALEKCLTSKTYIRVEPVNSCKTMQCQIEPDISPGLRIGCIIPVIVDHHSASEKPSM